MKFLSLPVLVEVTSFPTHFPERFFLFFFRTSLKDNLTIIRELQEEKDKLLDEVKQMKGRCSGLQSELDLVIKERADLQEASLNAERFVSAIYCIRRNVNEIILFII